MLIDNIEDESNLEKYYSILKILHNDRYGKLYYKLNSEQKEELEIAYKESLDEKNLIPHEEIKKKYEKWLLK